MSLGNELSSPTRRGTAPGRGAGGLRLRIITAGFSSPGCVLDGPGWRHGKPVGWRRGGRGRGHNVIRQLRARAASMTPECVGIRNPAWLRLEMLLDSFRPGSHVFLSLQYLQHSSYIATGIATTLGKLVLYNRSGYASLKR